MCRGKNQMPYQNQFYPVMHWLQKVNGLLYILASMPTYTYGADFLFVYLTYFSVIIVDLIFYFTITTTTNVFILGNITIVIIHILLCLNGCLFICYNSYVLFYFQGLILIILSIFLNVYIR